MTIFTRVSSQQGEVVWRDFQDDPPYGTVTVVDEKVTPKSLDWGGMKCPRLGPLND